MSAVANKLAEARKLIERGWVQGNCVTDEYGNACGYDQAANCCSFGAVALRTQHDYDLRQRVVRVLERVVGGDVVSWNDAPERTQAEVIAAFREAEKLARKQVSA